MDQPDTSSSSFVRTSAPLSFFLSYVSLATSSPEQTQCQDQHRIYIAQCPLSLLPAPLLADLPAPALVKEAGKGDIYDASLWLGLADVARTPLHRDPNPNIFVQVAGQKVLRLLRPGVGKGVLGAVRDRVGSMGSASGEMGTVRGEEMMGVEGRALDGLLWGRAGLAATAGIEAEEGWEVKLSPGDGIFIPEGWWHAVRGVGKGINASVSGYDSTLGCI